MPIQTLPRRLVTALLLLLALPVLAVDPVNTGRFSNVAIQGYDPVAFFENSDAVPGQKGITHEWNEAVWQFANAKHRDLFAADPEKYAPQYGGYCAYAASKGKIANGDAEAWTIWEGKLYLNYNKKIRANWQDDIPGNVAKADENWPRLLAE